MMTEKKRLCLLIIVLSSLITIIASGVVLGQASGMVKTAEKAGMGAFLVDGNGMTLYHFKNDSAGKSMCSGSCIEKWPAYYAEKITTAPRLNTKDFGTIKRDDGKKQTTYKGQPLYYFAKDKKPGDTFGNGLGSVWQVAPAK
jgi:predicted lipoprotein with Yx(FWY)xxD motif